MLYNAFLSCPLPRLNQRNPSTDVMSYKCCNSLWVSHMETAVEIVSNKVFVNYLQTHNLLFVVLVFF